MSIDPIIDPDLLICQPDNGFRFGMDSVLLAWFASVRKTDRVVDVGAGSGIISVLLARLKEVESIVSVELQDSMYECLAQTVALNSLQGTITPVHADVRTYKPKQKFDVAICNPPYRPLHSGHVSKNGVEAAARFNNSLSIDFLLKFCKSNVEFGGKVFFTGVSDRLVSALESCRAHNFEPKRLRFLHSALDKKAKIFFMECVHGGGIELSVEPPLIDDKNDPDNEYSRILKGKWK